MSMTHNMLHKQQQTNNHVQPPSKRIQNYLYKFADKLGKGSFSTVYKAINEQTKNIVAIKVIELASLKSDKLAELLNSQIKIIKKLNHKNVVKCYEVLTSLNNCYIITQLCQQGDLETKLKKNGTPFLQKEIYSFIKDIYQGLSYLAKENIVHRDLKISNIFLKEGTAKIADFGFAKVSKQSFSDVSIGSPLYMSPQGFINNLYGPKTDVWAFGILLYELTHGITPFHWCKNEKDLGEAITKQITTVDLKTQLSESLKNLIIRCLDCNEQSRITIKDIKETEFMKKVYTLSGGHRILNELNIGSRYNLKNFSNSVRDTNREQRSASLFNTSATYKFTSNFHSPSNVNCIANESNIYKKDKEIFKQEPSKNSEYSQYNFITNNLSNIISNSDSIHIKDLTTKNDNLVTVFDDRINKKDKKNSVQSKHLCNNDILTKTSEIKSNLYHQRKKLSQSFKNQGNMSCHLQFPKSKPFEANKNPYPRSPILEKYQLPKAEQIQNKQTQMPQYRFTSTLSKPYSSQQYYKNIQPCIDRRESFVVKKYFHNVIKFPKALNFNQALGLLHYCRLCFKYIGIAKSLHVYYDEKYSLWIMAILEQLMRKAESNNIIFEKKGIKEEKFKQVLKQYIQKYSQQFNTNKRSSLTINQNQITTYNIMELFKQDFNKNDDSLVDKLSQNYLKTTYYSLLICEFTHKIRHCQQLGDFNYFKTGQIEQILSGKKGPINMQQYLSFRKLRSF